MVPFGARVPRKLTAARPLTLHMVLLRTPCATAYTHSGPESPTVHAWEANGGPGRGGCPYPRRGSRKGGPSGRPGFTTGLLAKIGIELAIPLGIVPARSDEATIPSGALTSCVVTSIPVPAGLASNFRF